MRLEDYGIVHNVLADLYEGQSVERERLRAALTALELLVRDEPSGVPERWRRLSREEQDEHV